MITTIADFLNHLKSKEEKLLEKYNVIKHPGIIGSMYEGLTKDILAKSIFENLDLNITSGKIKNKNGELSDEIDCMITVGKGEKIPYTDKEIINSKNVLAVIQVKKNLYSKDIAESYSNLKSVIDIMDLDGVEDYHYRLLESSWRSICRQELPAYDEIDKMSYDLQIMHHVLKMEAYYPARIVWGYNGFKSEYAFRESYIKYIETKIKEDPNEKGLGPNYFPSLIICDKYSIFKTNGIPFAHPMSNNKWWMLYASTYDNPLYYLLEVIWTRLHFKYQLSAEIFGDDLQMEEIHGLIMCKFLEMQDKKGWVYEYVPSTKKQLEKKLEHKEWTPSIISDNQYPIIAKLCIDGEIDFKTESEEKKFILSKGYSIEEFCEELKKTGFISYIDEKLTLITTQLVVGINSKGQYFAGDNSTGRVSRWMVIQNMKMT